MGQSPTKEADQDYGRGMNILATDAKSMEEGGAELCTDSAGLCRNAYFDPFSAGIAERDNISFAAAIFALPASLTTTRSK